MAEAGKLTEKLIPMDRPLGHLLRTEAPEWMWKKVSAGARLPLEKMLGDIPAEGGVTRIYMKNEFWGIAVRLGDELIWRAQIPPENGPGGTAD